MYSTPFNFIKFNFFYRKSATSGETSPMQTPAEEGPGDQPQPPVIASEDDIFDGKLAHTYLIPNLREIYL